MSMAATELKTRVIQDAGELRAMRDALARVAELPQASLSVVQHPDWLLFELEWRGDIFSPYVIVVTTAAGDLVGYAPLLAYTHHARIAIGSRKLPIYRGRALRLMGSGAVAEPACQAAVESVVAEVLRRARLVRVLRIQETDLPNALATTLTTGARRFTPVQANLLDQLRWSIDPQPSLAAWLSGLGAKKRNNFTWRVRNASKKLGDQLRLSVFEHASDMDRYAALMNQVYAKSWHARELPIDWELPERKRLFARLAQEGRLIGYLMLLGDRPIAYAHGYRYGGSYLIDNIGYDDEFASVGIGSTLTFQVVCDRLERNPDEAIDFGYGDNDYKRALASRSTPCGSLYLVRGVSLRARFGMIVPLRGLYRWVRRWARHEQAASAA